MILLSLDTEFLDLKVVESVCKAHANEFLVCDVLKEHCIVKLQELRRDNCVDLNLDHKVHHSFQEQNREGRARCDCNFFGDRL